MTPEIALLVDLLERVGNSRGAGVLINKDELNHWPSLAFKAIKKQKLVVRSRPSRSSVCLGCEQGCVMPVHTLQIKSGTPPSFIICDKRNDINRVPVPSEDLIQWQCHADSICNFVATSLGLRRSGKQKGNNRLWEIGIATGKKRNQMLCLQANGGLVLVAGNNKVPLAELIKFHDDKYLLNDAMISQLVDTTTTADNRYTPSDVKREVRKLETLDLHAAWAKEYRKLKKQYPGRPDTWFAQKIARMDIGHDRNPETIRKNMKK